MQAIQKLAAATVARKLSTNSEQNIRRWLTEPQYAKYREPIEQLIEHEDFERLNSLFWEVINFGTGGRRGRMADFGSATINERTIAESAHGLAEYFKQTMQRDTGRAVVTCDTRNRSIEFARLTACVLAAHGLEVFYFDSHRATPELSYAVRHLNCDVGAMISASHNPPSDNGFKAYWNHGGQVLEPHDKGIIECVYRASEIPLVDFDEAVESGQIKVIGDEIDVAYLNELKQLSLSDARQATAIFTPLHGVGATSVYRLLNELGFDGVQLFGPQAEPDGNFTNVPDQLPNPERTEVFGPAVEAAEGQAIDLVLASDPDADRLGVMVRGRDGEWVHLSGNRVGALIVDYITGKRAAAGELTADHFVVETLVTTPLVGRIAAARGLKVVDDLLVGFKYIGQTMDALGPELFVFGTEESLGYLAGSYCRDKDAGIAALYVMEQASELKAEQLTLLDRLDALFVEHGYFAEGQRSKVCTGESGRQQIDQLMQAFRESPPTELAGVAMDQVRDYGQHQQRSLPDNSFQQEIAEPSGDLLMFSGSTESGQFRFAARPSGTEPKIKFYFFAEAPVSDADQLAAVREQTDQQMDRFADALLDWIDSTLQ